MSDQEKLILVANSKEGLDYIVPGSQGGLCDRCGKVVTLAPTSQAFLKEHPDAEISCVSCLTSKELEDFEAGGGKIELMKGQNEEVLHYRRRN